VSNDGDRLPARGDSLERGLRGLLTPPPDRWQGLDSLVHLERLALAGNQITEFKVRYDDDGGGDDDGGDDDDDDDDDCTKTPCIYTTGYQISCLLSHLLISYSSQVLPIYRVSRVDQSPDHNPCVPHGRSGVSVSAQDVQRLASLPRLSDTVPASYHYIPITILCGSLTGLSGVCVSVSAQDVQRLASLPRLSEVSFSDPHFGHCPIVSTDGYWNFALCYLKKVGGPVRSRALTWDCRSAIGGSSRSVGVSGHAQVA
jgi:hypothetical protein